MNYTHALVCTVDTIDGLDRCVWLFESEQRAIAFAIDKLVEVKLIEAFDGGYRFDKSFGDEIALGTDADTLEWFQDSLSSTEYFHVLPIEKL